MPTTRIITSTAVSPLHPDKPAPHPLRLARLQKNLTQLDLARRVGCSESTISKVETGRIVPDQSLREAISRELGISSWLVHS